MKKFFAFLLTGFLASTGFSQETNSQTAPAKNPAMIPVTRSNPTNWLARHEGFVKQAKAGGIDLLFMGDSITDGWRTRGKNVWEKVYGSRHAANFGIGGDRTQHVLWRIENGELDGIDPKVIVLMIGTNNSNSDSADQISQGVEKIVSDMREKCPKSKILLLAIFPRGKPDAKPEQMENINQVNQRIAKLDDGKMITFLDIGKAFLGDDGHLHADVIAIDIRRYNKLPCGKSAVGAESTIPVICEYAEFGARADYNLCRRSPPWPIGPRVTPWHFGSRPFLLR